LYRVIQDRDVTSGLSANHATTANYVPAKRNCTLFNNRDNFVVNVIGAGANVSALDTITITLGTAAQVLACAEKQSDVLYGSRFSGKGSLIDIDVAFSAGITTIAYAAV
jgi:ethanolamine utilization microcompartment shell protein EutS